MCAVLVFCTDIPIDSVIDATHIFDGLDAFPTHVAHMRLGKFVTLPSPWESFTDVATGNRSRLYSVALQWLKEDRDHRRELENNGRKRRGAQTQEVNPISECPLNLAQSGVHVRTGACRFRNVLSQVRHAFSSSHTGANFPVNYHDRYDYSH